VAEHAARGRRAVGRPAEAAPGSPGNDPARGFAPRAEPFRFGSTVALPKTDPYVVKPFADAAKAMATIPGIQAAALFDPNLVLTDAIKGQTISDTKVIIISTKGVENSGIVNAPFVVKNANAASLDAIFWIETVTQPGSDPILQLQYTQRVILDFDQVHWPHISVATLVKQ
jgi:hypothetical protein